MCDLVRQGVIGSNHLCSLYEILQSSQQLTTAHNSSQFTAIHSKGRMNEVD